MTAGMLEVEICVTTLDVLFTQLTISFFDPRTSITVLYWVTSRPKELTSTERTVPCLNYSLVVIFVMTDLNSVSTFTI